VVSLGWTAIALYAASIGFASAAAIPSIGLNKFDLALQYLGRASGGNASPESIRVDRAMGKKAITDAHQLGVRYFRIAMTGFAPTTHGANGDLELWVKDPAQYWAMIDVMMADLKLNDIELVPSLAFNPVQFPAMAGETTHDLFLNPNSRSWQLLAKYVSEFVNRYRGKGLILFYELTNELNLGADIDLLGFCGKTQKPPACEVMSNFTTADLGVYTTRFANLIRSLDPGALISSGFSMPRPAAEHLRAHPATAGKVDWTPDSVDELTTNLRIIHQNLDIISVHIYPGEEHGRFGKPDRVDPLAITKQAADKIGKPLFVGEFGDPNIKAAAEDSFVDRMLDELVALRVPYSAMWVFEFYQFKTYSTYDSSATQPNIEPGYTDRILSHLTRANEKFGSRPPAASAGAAPTVVITWPLDCRPYTGEVPIHAVASDQSGAVTRVEFWVDDKKIDTSTAAPYTANWKPDGLSAGDHRLVAKAYDAAGKVGEYGTVLRVGNSAPGQGCPVK
jgi:hypothetical protein